MMSAIPERQAAIDALYNRLFPPKLRTEQHQPTTEEEANKGSHRTFTERGTSPDDLTDDEILTLVASAHNAPKFGRLWSGDTSDYADDESRADAGLAGILAFYTSDAGQIERLMRQSGLARPKWDHHKTYLVEKTIQGAIDLVTKRYHRSIPVTVTTTSAPTVPFQDATGHATGDTTPCLELVAQLDQARARIAELERENATLKAELADVRGNQSRTMAVLRNPHAKAVASVAIALANSVKAATSQNPTHTGPVRVFMPELGERAGRSASTASRVVTELASYGLIDKQEESVTSWKRDNRTREMKPVEVTRVDIALKDSPERFLEKIAALVPPKPTHGGRRIRCTNHPDADVIAQCICAECGEILSQKTLKADALQDEMPADNVLNQDVVDEVEQPFQDETRRTSVDDVPTSLPSTPLQPTTSVVPLYVANWKTPLKKEDVTPSVLPPMCPKCATLSERQGTVVTDDGRGRFQCPSCSTVFWSELRAHLPNRERFERLALPLSDSFATATMMPPG